MRKEDFYTKPNADKGVKIPLLKADGSESGDWLMVRGAESDAFRKARFEGARKMRDIPAESDDWDRALMRDAVVMDSLVSLVAGWSFDEPCTDESVRELLTNSPSIADLVDQTAVEKSRFFGSASDS